MPIFGLEKNLITQNSCQLDYRGSPTNSKIPHLHIQKPKNAVVGSAVVKTLVVGETRVSPSFAMLSLFRFARNKSYCKVLILFDVYLASHLRSCVLHLVLTSTEVITQQCMHFIGCQGNRAWVLSLYQSCSDTQYISSLDLFSFIFNPLLFRNIRLQ